MSSSTTSTTENSGPENLCTEISQNRVQETICEGSIVQQSGFEKYVKTSAIIIFENANDR
ncbi:hypothetical protein LPAF129_10910 [Ligilactobacillus pabuli]|uniref:Uncharacterized protein n=1 Tax=Ligilactobacillus pabuli TaxID=2886039 RepID=A0ABQ5JKJ2_9LACO|nr:hypothetical protein LPAF129_10910 [Ligilactobacillus pabuli]